MALSVKVGTYTGTGGTSGTRAITGVGFTPKFVFVWSDSTSEIYPVWSIDSAITGLGSCMAYWGENGWNTGTTADRFQSFDSDGFTISIGSQATASMKPLNGNAINYYYLALGGTDIYSSNYTGNGSDNRNITGVGFTPELVWMMGGSQHSTFKTTITGASTDISQFHYNGADAANNIQALQSDGFQVGTGNQSNANTVVYYYFAVKGSADIISGTYTGNGSDSRDITDVGFQANFIHIKGTSTQNPAMRSSDMASDNTKFYRSSGFQADCIQSILSNGFQVGTNASVNTNAVTYRYLAIKIPSGGGEPAYIPKIIMS